MNRKIEVIGFDLFGTIFNVLGNVPEQELDDYAFHLSEYRRTGVWKPLTFPKSWETLPLFGDVREGFFRLRDSGLYLVALSNAPLALTMRMSRYAGIKWDAIIPLETIYEYKTDPKCYELAASLCGVPHDRFLMVSGNKKFGDIEAARSLGMEAQLIRNPNCPADTIELARLLTGN